MFLISHFFNLFSFSSLISQWSFLISQLSLLISHFSFLIPHFLILVSYFSILFFHFPFLHSHSHLSFFIITSQFSLLFSSVISLVLFLISNYSTLRDAQPADPNFLTRVLRPRAFQLLAASPSAPSALSALRAARRQGSILLYFTNSESIVLDFNHCISCNFYSIATYRWPFFASLDAGTRGQEDFGFAP